MVFYGTGAAEGIPSPFCGCPVCHNARIAGGREIRRRSMLRINEETCIDMGADAFQEALEYGDFIALQNVLVTHTHEDHLAYMMMNVRNMARVRPAEPLGYYLTGGAYEIAGFYRYNPFILKGLVPQMEERKVIAFHQLQFGGEYEIGGMVVTPLRGNHKGGLGEDCANYLIRLRDGRRIYYGLDTGWYLDETFRALKGAALDIFISECTFGLTEGRGEYPAGHLDAFACLRLIQRLYGQGTLRPDTRIFLTHINHYTSTHEQLTRFFAEQALPCPLTVAWDGLRIE